jgi:DNA repair protein RecO (recombination protein O)
MPQLSDTVVVLRLSDYSESSQIVTLFGRRHGQARVIAKGLRRSTKARVSVGLDLLELGEATYVPTRSDGLGTLGEWKILHAHLGLRGTLLRLYAGLYAAELTACLTQPADPHEDLFDALLDFLTGLDAGGPDIDACRGLVRFQADLLKSIGLAPNLRSCVVCGRPRVAGSPAHFSSSAGGYVCRACVDQVHEKHAIPRALLDGARGTTSPVQWFGLLDYHLTHVAGRALALSSPLHRLMTGK